METEEDVLEWLESKDEYYVTEDEYEEFLVDFDLNLVGVTMAFDEETEEVKIPKRDIRHAIIYGHPLD